MSEPIEFDVIGGMCRIQFRMGSSCGSDPDAKPGVAFTVISDVKASERNGKFYSGMGVFTRSNAKRLADAINAFLAEEPPLTSEQCEVK